MRFVKSTLQKRIQLLNLFPIDNNLRIVEVGVYKGHFAKQIFERSIKDSISNQLFLVDPWNSPQCEGQMVGSQKDGLELLVFFQKHNNVFLENTFSQEASRRFRDDALDLVYLDAEHTYDGVYGDIELWLKKVKPGGILAGHDIFSPEHIGVTQAVIDSFSCCVYIIPAEECPYTKHTVNPSWYIVK